MAAIYEVGSLTSRTTVGQETYSLSKFSGVTPKALIIFSDCEAAAGGSVHGQGSIGFATATDEEYCVSWWDRADASTTTSYHGHWDKVVVIQDVPPDTMTVTTDAQFISFGVNEFTLDWLTVNGTGRIVRYLVIGGSDITDVKAIDFTAKTSTGNQSSTAVGFIPDGVLFVSSGMSEIVPPDPARAYSDQQTMIGCIDDVGAEASITWRSDHGVMNNNDRGRSWSSGKIALADNTSQAIDWSFSWTSWDANGWTINWDNAATSADHIFALAIKGRKLGLGTSAMPTSAATKATTLGIGPDAAIMLTTGQTAASDSLDTYVSNGLGVADDTSEMSMSWQADHDDPADTNSYSSSTKFMEQISDTSGSVESVANINTDGSWDANGLTVKWTTVSGSADNYIVIGLEGAAAAGGPAVQHRASTIWQGEVEGLHPIDEGSI